MAKNILVINRGDTCSFTVDILNPNDTSKIYFLEENDYVFVGITAPHQRFEDAMVRIKLSKEDQLVNGLMRVVVPANITEQWREGVYFYEVKFVTKYNTPEEEVYTIINKTKLVVNN